MYAATTKHEDNATDGRFSAALDNIFSDVDMILIGVKSSHDAPSVFPGCFIHLSEIHHLSFAIFTIAVMEEDDLRSIEQFRILLDLNHDPNLIGIQ